MKFAGNKEWSADEQSGVNAADDVTLELLAQGNQDYEKKFGYIFIVCASGKSADEMLGLLQERLPNSAENEISIAANEQRKITQLRLQKLERNHMNPITTHILDTSLGRPAAGVSVALFRADNGDEKLLGQAATNGDGRIAEGLIRDADYSPGIYRIEFDTEAYFSSMNATAFYPSISITFRVSPGEAHYHVPLLLSPFGYSTYRGS